MAMRFDLRNARPLIGGPCRRSCEENLARVAWASGKLRLKPAAEQLQTLLHYPGLDQRPVYARQAREALSSGCPEQQAAALVGLRQETERLRAVQQQCQQLVPALY